MSSFLAGVSLIYCLYALTTITFATFLGGAFVLFIGWLTYMIRFNILKTNFIINQEAKRTLKSVALKGNAFFYAVLFV